MRGVHNFEYGDGPVLAFRQALALDSVPDSLVVSAGYIGMELAGVFAKLGTEVTVIDQLHRKSWSRHAVLGR